MPGNHILSSTVAMLPLAPQSEGEDSSPAHLVSLELHRAVRAPEAMRLCGLKTLALLGTPTSIATEQGI